MIAFNNEVLPLPLIPTNKLNSGLNSKFYLAKSLKFSISILSIRIFLPTGFSSVAVPKYYVLAPLFFHDEYASFQVIQAGIFFLLQYK